MEFKMNKMECFVKKSRKGCDRIVDDIKSCTEPISEIFFAMFILIGMILPIIIISGFVFLNEMNHYVAMGLIILSGIITYVWSRCIYCPLIECFIIKGDDVK
jgi:hypothetical protein